MKKLIIILMCLFKASFSLNAQTTDSLIVNDLRHAGVSFSHNNSVTLLTSGQEKFDDMFCAIRQAKSSVHLEYFNFRNDSIADLLFSILADKVKEGVEVRALFDGFGNMSNNRPLKKRHIKKHRANGIQLYEFKPIRFPWIDAVFGRDHRKIVIIDGQVAYTGGMNVADYYIKGTKVVGEWRDMHCRIEGDEVNTLQTIFLKAWKKVTGEEISGEKYFTHSNIEHTFTNLKEDTTSTAGRQMVGIVNREPNKTPKIMREFYKSAIDNAQDSILIVNPYFTLIPCINKSLKKAIKRGVKVNLMIAKNSDIPLTPDCSFRKMYKLMKRGANVWIYENGFHHTKIIMVDGQVCTVGSSNLDSRSLRYDYEENAVIVDRAVTKELSDMFEHDKKHSFVLTKESWDKWRTPWQKFRGWFASLLTPFL